MRHFVKKAIQFSLALFLFVLLAKPVSAQGKPVNLYFFWSKTCPHCKKEEAFLEKIEPRYSNLVIHDFEVGANIQNALLFRRIGEELKIEVGGVPMTFIGKSYIVGFHSDQTTGAQIVALIERLGEEGDPDVVGQIVNPGKPTISPTITPIPTVTEEPELTPTPVEETKTINVPEELNIPFIGAVAIKNLSLPALTLIVAFLDGFNPCAMWVLLFLISMLLGMKNRTRMWILGITFIAASSFVYFLFLSAWLNLFLFLGFVFWVRILVGIVALTMGVYQLRDYVKNKDGACEVAGSEKRKKIFEKIKNITQNRKLLLALLGIIVLAFAVNLIELVCSAGLPAIYTQVLTLTPLPRWQYYLYLLFYIFIFMIDDMFVFVLAMTTLKAVGIEGKYARYSRLVGGIIILAIGILMLFKPELLMFG